MAASNESLLPPPPPKLSLHTLPTTHHNPHHPPPTPPHPSFASVPFSWEELPGKPLPTTTLTVPTTQNRSLNPPPRLHLLPSPPTVLHGPYLSRSDSLRSLFGSDDDDGWAVAGLLKRWRRRRRRWRNSGEVSLRSEASHSSPSRVSSSSSSSSSSKSSFAEEGCGATKVKITRFRRKGSLFNLSDSDKHIWGSIQGSLKQLIQWRAVKN